MSSCTNCHGPNVKHTSAHCPKNSKPTNSADVDTIIDELVQETIEQAYNWYGYEAPHDVEYYDHTLPKAKQQIKALLSDQVKAARIEGMEKAKSRVLRRTEIPADAKNPTRDATVYLGEAIADIIQSDINELKALSPTNDKELEV